MIGRTNVITGDPARLDEAVAFVRTHVQPVVDSLPGSHGLGMWIDRPAGVAVVQTVWADRAALDASEPHVTDLRRRAAEVLAASGAQVAIHEPVVIWQAGPDLPGHPTRVVQYRLAPGGIDALTARSQQDLPRMQQLPGANTVALLVDRSTGDVVLTISYRSRADLDASREPAAALRAAALAALPVVDGPHVSEMEVAIVGIRGPEVPQQAAVADAARPVSS